MNSINNNHKSFALLGENANLALSGSKGFDLGAVDYDSPSNLLKFNAKTPTSKNFQATTATPKA